MPKPIDTLRLELRPVSLSDFEFLKKMQTNAQVMAHIGSGSIRSPEQIKTALDLCLKISQENPWLGQWVVKEKASQQDIGAFILRPPATQEKTAGLEIGFSYLPESWGKGYASEAAQAVIEHARKNLPGNKIIALVDEDHEASKKVLTKIGMKPVGKRTYVNPVTGDGKECLLMEWVQT